MADDPQKVASGLLDVSDASIGAHAAAISTFEAGLKKTVAGMRGRLIDLLSSGEITPETAKRAQSLITLQTELSKQLNAEGYPALVKELIGSYDASVTSAIAAVKEMKLPDERLAPLDRGALKQLKNVDYDYLQTLGQDAVNAVARTVISSTVGGAMPRAKLIDSIAATLDTKLKGHAATYADTALVTYDRTVSMQVWEAAGIKKFVLRGPKDIKNRPLCAKYVNQVFTLAEIKALDKEAAAASSAPLLPVLRFGFGWNCRHVWTPWPDDIPAPQPMDGEKKPQAKAKSANQKPEWTLKDASPKMGGAHAKEIWTDAAGSDWLFKPVDASKKIIPYAEEAASKVAALVNPQTAVEVRTITLGGKFGSVQKLIPEVAGDLVAPGAKGNKPVPMEALTAYEAQQLQREHVVDWLVSNHDGHPGNFLKTKPGALYGIDKAQAFKHLGKDKLSVDYHPNAAYGEQEPLYNTLGKAVKAGKVPFNPADTLPAIEAVEKISDADYLAAIDGYVKNHPGGPAAGEAMAKAALARKNGIREDFTKYYRELTGDKHFDFDAEKWAAAKKAEADAIAAAKKKAEEEAAAKAKAEAEAKAKALAEIEKLKAEIAAKKAKALAAYELQLTTGKKPGPDDAHVLKSIDKAALDQVAANVAKAKAEAEAKAKAEAEAKAAAIAKAQAEYKLAKEKALKSYVAYLEDGAPIPEEDDAILAGIPESELKSAEDAHAAKQAAAAAAAKKAAEEAAAAAAKAEAEAIKADDAEAKRLARNAYNRERRAKKKGGGAAPGPEPDAGEFKHLDARNAAYVETAKAAGWQGKSLAIDKDQIEDQNVLVWQEKTAKGERTVLRMKVRPEAQADVLRAIGADLSASAAGMNVLPSQKADAELVPIPIQPVSKQIFNQLVNGSLKLSDPGTTWKFGWGGQLSPEQVTQLKKEYTDWKVKVTDERARLKKIEEEEAKKNGKPSASDKPFTVTKSGMTADAKKMAEGAVTVEEEDVGFGNLYQLYGGENRVTQLNLKWGDGARARYLPFAGDDAYAFQGTLEVTLPGAVDAKQVDRGLQKLADMGLNSSAATKVDEELLYLQKAAYVAKLHKTPAWKKAAAAGSDEEKLVRMRRFWADHLGVDDVTKLPEYKPEGEHQLRWDKPGERAGYRVQQRFDLTEKQLASEMKGYTLAHDPGFGGGTIQGFLEAALPNNASLVSTTEKARSGITRKGAGSASADIGTGGASYVFTRIAKPGARKSQLYFKQSLLRRMDAISYSGDKYGRTTGSTVEQNRATTVEQFKQYSDSSSNETIFKHGINVLEELDHIKATDAYHRDQIIAVFKKYGVTKLPDGRPIEQVVQ